MTKEYKKGLCGMCRSQCAIQVGMENGKIVEVQADRNNIRGRLCARGALAGEVIYGEKRIKNPLIRVGKKGEGKFRESSWNEAMDVAAERIRKVIEKNGAQALASYFGQGVLEDTIGAAGDKFFKMFGSPNDMDCGSICNIVSSRIAPVTTLGFSKYYLEADIENAEAIIVWGKNPKTDDGPERIYEKLEEAKKHGVKIVVIDPRKKGTGEIADLWIPIIPGTDGALAAAMMKAVFERDALNKEFIEKYTVGFGELKKYINTLKVSELLKICGIENAKFDSLMDIFCSSDKIPYLSYTGLEYQPSGVQNIRMMINLWALTGKIDVKGGMYINGENIREFIGKNNFPDNVLPVGAEEYPVFTLFSGKGQFASLPQAIISDKPYPIRGLLIAGGSPVITYPESRNWKKAYEKLDIMIVMERYLTEDARYADVVFPVTTWYENASILELERGIQLREPFIKPIANARNDIFILQALAEKFGYGDQLPKNNEELYLWALNGNEKLLKKLKKEERHYVETVKKKEIVYEKYKKGMLRADGKNGFPTSTGKFEIDSTILKKYGYDGIPKYKHISEYINTEQYPFILTTGARGNVRIGSFGQNIPAMARYEKKPYVELSRETAESLNIKNEEIVNIITPFGEKRFPVKVCDMAKNVLHIPFGGGSSYMNEEWKNGNVNDLCDLNLRDEISGFPIIKTIPCRIEKSILELTP